MCCTLIVGFQDLFFLTARIVVLFLSIYTAKKFWKVSSRRHVLKSHCWKGGGGTEDVQDVKKHNVTSLFCFPLSAFVWLLPACGPVRHTNTMTETEGVCVMWSASDTQVHRICYLLLEVGTAILCVNQKLFQITLWIQV